MSGDHVWARLILVAGLLHFTQIPAMFAAGKLLDWRGQLALLSPVNRRILRVIVLAIVVVMLGLGAVVVASARELAAGSRPGGLLAGFLALFLGYRAFVQWVIYAPVWPRGPVGRASHVALGSMFSFQTVIYLGACLRWALAA